MDWHRLFGLILTDFFTGSPFAVELEKELSLRKQLLDVAIVRCRPGRFSGRLPDGLDNLAPHNLLTFKSLADALDDWTLKELTGYFVSYRKQATPARQPLLPENAFQLYAVTSRFPHNLANQVPLEQVVEGVYDCRRGTDNIRVIVAGQVSQAAHNAVWHLFSASAEKVVYGAEHYQQRSDETNTLLQQLFQRYQKDGITMSYTMADFRRDYVKEHLKELSLQERLDGVSPKELVRSLSPEQLQQLANELRSKPSSQPRKPRRRR